MLDHTIRTRDGGTVRVKLTRSKAIKAFCTECLGWEGNPRDCEARLCPLWPFRGRILLAFGGRESAKDEKPRENGPETALPAE